MNNDYNRSPQEVLEELGSLSHRPDGAAGDGAAGQYGPNKLQEAEKPTLLQRFLTQLKDSMLLILLAAAAVSAVTNALSGESFTEVFIILIVVLLNAVLGVVQESKAEAAIEALQTMTAAKCKVLRDGQAVIETPSWCPATWFCWRPATPCRPTAAPRERLDEDRRGCADRRVRARQQDANVVELLPAPRCAAGRPQEHVLHGLHRGIRPRQAPSSSPPA